MAKAESVYLHVYNCCKGNTVQHALWQQGIYHGSVEVYGVEWNFGGGKGTSTGVHTTGNMPGKDTRYHSHVDRIYQGSTKLSEEQVCKIIEDMKPDWKLNEYDLLNRNCCHFATALLDKLGVSKKEVPRWVNRAAESSVNRVVATSGQLAGQALTKKAAQSAGVRFIGEGAARTAAMEAAGPVGWCALAGELGGGCVGGHLYGETGENVGGLLGAVGTGAVAGSFWPAVGTGIGAAIGGASWCLGKVCDYASTGFGANRTYLNSGVSLSVAGSEAVGVSTASQAMSRASVPPLQASSHGSDKAVCASAAISKGNSTKPTV